MMMIRMRGSEGTRMLKRVAEKRQTRDKYSTWVRMNLEAISESGQKVLVRNRGQMLNRTATLKDGPTHGERLSTEYLNIITMHVSVYKILIQRSRLGMIVLNINLVRARTLERVSIKRHKVHRSHPPSSKYRRDRQPRPPRSEPAPCQGRSRFSLPCAASGS